MRQLLFGLCVVAAACSSQPVSPTGPSSAALGTGTQTQANGGAANIDVTFVKWITAYPMMAGRTGGSVEGTYAGEVLSRIPFENGTIVQLDARYEVIDPLGEHSFIAHISGSQNLQIKSAVLNGTITEGWHVGAQVHVTFDVISPCPAEGKPACFVGTIRIMPGSAK
jgi:hypothetical protein